MPEYNFVSDDLDKRGFISKESILDLVTQEEIFELVFNSLPEEFEYITSPFRIDKSPGCWFHYHTDGKLRFIDFANQTVVNGISMKNIDCFDAVQVFFRIPNFYLTLDFIYNTLVVKKGINQSIIIRHKPVVQEKRQVKILIEPKLFELRDKNFWTRFGITKAQLIEDRTYSFSRYHLLNTKKGNFSSISQDIAYSFNDFPQGRKKLYFPKKEKSNRFISTCTKNDIGGMSSLAPFGRQLVITKAYKDWRVLKNQGKHTVWFQNEGAIPDIDLLIMLVKRFREVIVFFDNDNAGIQASQIVTAVINSQLPGKARALWLHESLQQAHITDPSDLYYHRGQPELLKFLNQFT